MLRDQGYWYIVDAEGNVASALREHTSRAFDPQLHTRVVVANRVRSDDGRWLVPYEVEGRRAVIDGGQDVAVQVEHVRPGWPAPPAPPRLSSPIRPHAARGGLACKGPILL